MKQAIVVPVALLLISAALWFFSQGRQAANSQAPEPVDAAAATLHAPSLTEEEPVPPAVDVLRLPSCPLLPIQEQSVAAQVDGLILKVEVALGQKVKAGQVLARLDDAKLQLQAQLLEIRAVSKTDELIAEANLKEADARVRYAEQANLRGSKAVPELEFTSYLAQRERFIQEIKKAREDRQAAQKEVEKIKNLLAMHQVTSVMDGEVVRVFKRDGETVKQAETLFTIVRLDRLRIEGFCKVHQAALLRPGMPILAEPEVQGTQRAELIGHTDTVTDLAAAPDGKLVASASRDGTVILWAWPKTRRLAALPHPGAVLAVDVLARAAERGGGHVIVTGCEDGKLRAWGWDGAKANGPLWTAAGHEGPVLCVRAHPEKNLLVSGGEDRKIKAWDVHTGTVLGGEVPAEAWKHAFHQGGVTDLRWGPDGTLISCGRDKVLKTWSVRDNEPKLTAELRGRAGDVVRLGMRPDGKVLLFDHGDELRLVHPRSGAVHGVLPASKGAAFQGFALFSPRGRLILTHSADGRCHIWRAPEVLHVHVGADVPLSLSTGQQDVPLAELDSHPDLVSLGAAHGGFEIRHYSAPRPAEMKCAAFAPDEKAFFTAGVDHVVRAWDIPPPDDWQPRLAVVTHVGSTIEPGTDLIRIQAEVDNSSAGKMLRPGGYVQVKAFPSMVK